MEHQFKDSVKIRIGFIYIFALEVIYWNFAIGVVFYIIYFPHIVNTVIIRGKHIFGRDINNWRYPPKVVNWTCNKKPDKKLSCILG
jgi:hypothetical protein